MTSKSILEATKCPLRGDLIICDSCTDRNWAMRDMATSQFMGIILRMHFAGVISTSLIMNAR